MKILLSVSKTGFYDYIIMYEYITGKLAELTPSYAVIDNNGIGWLVNISLNTFSALEGKSDCKVLIHQVIREDANILYGFADAFEREVFRMLIDVSGVGPNTARVVLSSMSPVELQNAVIQEDAKLIGKVKGIGPKTAQRIVIDLKDKIKKSGATVAGVTSVSPQNMHRDEALAALVMLGYQKAAAEKAVDAALKHNPSLSAEDLIKLALRSV